VENINLMFTGDIPAVEPANNPCAAAIDASILHGKEPGDRKGRSKGYSKKRQGTGIPSPLCLFCFLLIVATFSDSL